MMITVLPLIREFNESWILFSFSISSEALISSKRIIGAFFRIARAYSDRKSVV